MINWKRAGKTVTNEGTVITYEGVGTDYYIKSIKKHIPHAGRPGTWDHTTYWLIDVGSEGQKEFQALKDAKEYAEKLEKEFN